jgi:two-component sensor histidine kinase
MPYRCSTLQSHLMSELAKPARLDALAATGLLDTPPEADFDRITRLIRGFLHVDVALISLVDDKRQFFKSSAGLTELAGDCTGTPLTHSFCQHVVISEQVLAVADARMHELVKDNLAVRDLNVIAYLGVPLHTGDGEVIGSVCAIDTSPRLWTDADRETLIDFAGIVENAIALRVESSRAVQLADRNQILANEYNHRAKNLLAVVKSLVNLSARESETRDGLIATLTGRLDAYGQAHDALSGASGLFELTSLMRRLLTPYKHSGAVIITGGVPVLLSREQITPVCLIIHELATNSAKYGAFRALKLPSVSWVEEPGRVVVTWAEPVPHVKHRRETEKGFGTKLLSVAARQLGGEILRVWEDEKLMVSFPIKLIAPQS